MLPNSRKFVEVMHFMVGAEFLLGNMSKQPPQHMCRGSSVQKGLWSTLDKYGLLVHHMLGFCKTCHELQDCNLCSFSCMVSILGRM